ncbi:putative 115 kDa protein in type-1 retrotransposable element R1DM [Trichonephila clavipes]|nr:putative 115 kDa protein in type-1 retrotransposable element R1DM [Trichonephila clavipes]
MRGTLTGQRYVDDILRPRVGTFLNGLSGAIFQQDNARPRTAGGSDTTSAAITWTLFMLGLYSDAQKKAHEELDWIFGEDVKRPATEDDLKDMKYLECVIKVISLHSKAFGVTLWIAVHREDRTSERRTYESRTINTLAEIMATPGSSFTPTPLSHEDNLGRAIGNRQGKLLGEPPPFAPNRKKRQAKTKWRQANPTTVTSCPQGSVLSPTLWNIYFNPILSLNSELFLLRAFADDLAVVSFGLSRRELEDNTNKILSLVNSKLSELNLSIATAKTVSVAFRCPFLQCRGFRGSTTFRRNPIFKIGSNSIHISKSYKYLGVNIDNRLSWTPHINSIKDKILWISSNFYRVSKNFNHQHISLMKLWYTSVVQPIMSYGAGVWGGSLTSIQVQKLKSIQRIYLLKITKAYKTSPTDALNILSGIPPIHIVIRSLYFKFQLWSNRNDLLPGLIPATKLDSFISLHQILPDFLSFPINTFEGQSEWEVYTDGSKIDSNVGFAVCIFFGALPLKHISLKFRILTRSFR